MATILDRILATKYQEVVAASAAVPLEALQSRAAAMPAPRDFVGALRTRHQQGLPAVIAEIKRASPSQGVMNPDLDPAAVARDYESAGAACLSVLTDREYFQGAPADLIAAKAACTLPVLRKDFMVDPYQVWEARAMGADCILLISGAISLSRMLGLAEVAAGLGMAVLVESHTEAQLLEALKVPTPLIGLNNRDLASFRTDLGVTESLSPIIPLDRIVVAESGIRDLHDVTRLQAVGVQTFLVGGAFMASRSPGEQLKKVFPQLAK